jgi:hypothetical protein
MMRGRTITGEKMAEVHDSVIRVVVVELANVINAIKLDIGPGNVQMRIAVILLQEVEGVGEEEEGDDKYQPFVANSTAPASTLHCVIIRHVLDPQCLKLISLSYSSHSSFFMP